MIRMMIGLVGAVAALTLTNTASAEDSVTLGVMADMTGPQAGITGKYDVEAVRMAVEKHGGKALGRPVKVVVGDAQYKVDLEISIAQRWYEQEGVDAIIGVPLSPAAVQIAHLAEKYNKIMLTGTSGTRKLTTTDCTPNSVSYGWNTSALANITPKALIAQGKKKWFFLTMDYTYGVDQADQAMKAVKQYGGAVLGEIRYPMNQTDFSGHILKAMSSEADVIAVSSSGADTQAIVKQANEFGVKAAGKSIVVFALFDSDVKAIGLQALHGLVAGVPFYWNRDDETRTFGLEFIRRTRQAPNWINAGNYSAALSYLRAVDMAATKDARAVMKTLKTTKINDMYAKGGYIRQDGQMVHDMYVAKVKAPDAPRLNDWDLFDVVETVSGEEVFPAMEACKLLKH